MYNVGDKLFAIITFVLHGDARWNNDQDYYFGVGDILVIDNISYEPKSKITNIVLKATVPFTNNLKQECKFNWYFKGDEINKLKEFMLYENEYKKKIRKDKISQLNESTRFNKI